MLYSGTVSFFFFLTNAEKFDHLQSHSTREKLSSPCKIEYWQGYQKEDWFERVFL